jgi:hypothetical protein
MNRRDLSIVAPLLLLSLAPTLGTLVRLTGLVRGDAPARFVEAPLPILLHIASVLPWALIGAFQFTPSLRRGTWHRRAGTILVGFGLLTGLSGLWMTATYDVPAGMEGPLLHAVRWLVGIGMVGSVMLGVVRVKQRDFASHEAWMIRAYALSLGAGMQAVLLLPLAIAGNDPRDLLRDVLMTVAWVINLAFAEWLIRRHPARPVPSAA